MKPYSQACENNKQSILECVREVFVEPGLVLEIGSGTGQHAEFLAARLPHLQWQPTDHPSALDGCEERLREAGLANILPPLALDVAANDWPLAAADAAFSANTAHIMGWPEVQAMFLGLAAALPFGAPFCLYGPFNYAGNFTSDSNRVFDEQLRSRAPHMGIKDIEDLLDLGALADFMLDADHAMPANNRLLVWRKT
ncbi:DUF938 domain-containing protein [Haliea sp. E1-2-M8]|uniref:DUF938 domain-containing protein n=1 Tax=Haliea sp. E1-2-M8 TaxID=3064706 RepID=UPI002728D7B2|nr:DUF938 domain-containing protein [Haliea sp. E1-2-M8]MDO8862369.1 DUF938 domain-containing protein [Haliea sp. E1-2-M8]